MCGSIRASIVASDERKEGGDLTFPLAMPNNQESLYMRVDFPFPTLHLASSAMIFLDHKILFQAKDPDEEFASKIEQFGKHLALKTL